MNAGMAGYCGTPQKKCILENTASGVALVYYDKDGWLGICMVNGSTNPVPLLHADVLAHFNCGV
jgi:hypothetical protein